MAGTQPKGAGWRAFSWHPMLMTCGMVGMVGSAAVTKKLGGYTNTKVRTFLKGLFIWVNNLTVVVRFSPDLVAWNFCLAWNVHGHW